MGFFKLSLYAVLSCVDNKVVLQITDKKVYVLSNPNSMNIAPWDILPMEKSTLWISGCNHSLTNILEQDKKLDI